MKKTACIVILLTLISLSGMTQTTTKGKSSVVKPADPKKITSVEGITEYELANGLKVLLFPDPSKQTITVNITYLVGSKHENYGETGMAHLLEHLVFKGTPNHPNIPQELTERGARPNGTTWTDRTNYFETFQATEDNLKWALDLESDRMVNSFIAAKDLESEMTVVRNEFESGENSPFRVLMERVMSTAYLWHNYGKSTIGARSDLENVPIERLQAFYKNYYQPDNAVLVVAGKIDEVKTLQLVNEYFGKIPRPERKLQKLYTKDPIQDGERFVSLKRVGDVQVAIAAYHIAPGSHEDYAPITVLTSVLGSEPSGRLYKALVETKKASYAGAFSFQFAEPSLLLTYAQVLKEKSLEEAKNTLVTTLDQIKNNPPTEDEVTRAKNELLKQIELSMNSSESIGLRLSEFIGMGDWRLFFLNRDRINQVKTEDVIRVANHYLKPDNRTTGLFIPTENPDRAEIPSAPIVADLVKDYKGQELKAQGEAFDPSPANIHLRNKISTLPNGAKLALLSKKTRGESVDIYIMLRFGSEQAVSGKSTMAEFAGSLLNKGTSKLTRQQIKDKFDELKANVFIGGGATSAYAVINTTRPNAPTVIQLVKELFTDSIFPEEEFEKLKAEQISDIEESRSEPQSVAVNRISRHLWPVDKNNIRYTMTFDEKIEAIKNLNLSDVRKFYKDFYGASNATISLVGDFDENDMTNLITESFGQWKSTQPFERIISKKMPYSILNENIETPDKANAFFYVSYNFELRDSDPDYPALVVGNFMLGGGFLNSRLATRIRQKEGLSYGVGSGFSASALDNYGTFTAYAIYAPENVEKLEAAFLEEIQKVIDEGFTKEEVSAAVNGWLQSRNVTRAQDRSLANTLSSYLFIDRTLLWDAELEKKVSELTPEQIHSAMKKYIRPELMNIVKAGDFAKGKK